MNIERVFEKRDKLFPKCSKQNFLDMLISVFCHYVALNMSETKTKYSPGLVGKPLLTPSINTKLWFVAYATCHMLHAKCHIIHLQENTLGYIRKFLWVLVMMEFCRTHASHMFGGRLKYLNFWPFSAPIFSHCSNFWKTQ